MRPSEVRDYVLRDHQEIAQRLHRLEELARHLIDGRMQLLETVRTEVTALHDALAAHMEWEDRFLRPVLAIVASERVDHFDRDHAEQRDLFMLLRERALEPSRTPLLVAGTALDLVRILREDMVTEESVFLDEALLVDEPHLGGDGRAAGR